MHGDLLAALSAITAEEKTILATKAGIDADLYFQENELVIDSHKLLSRGRLIEIRPHTRFVHFPKHRHNYIEVIYMCRGTSTHILDGESLVLEAGDLLFLNQHTTQEILPAGEDDIAVNFIILPEFFQPAFSMISMEESLLRSFLMDALFEKNGQYPYLCFKVADVLPVQNLIENMIWTLFYEHSNKRRSQQLTMGLLLLELVNHMDKMQTGVGRFDRELIGTSLNFIDEHYRDGTLTDLAEQLHLDAVWLSKEIKKRTGKTYKELLQTRRLEQAIYLLETSQLSIEEVAQAVGYDNKSYFYRLFERRFACSPAAYRRKHRLLATN